MCQSTICCGLQFLIPQDVAYVNIYFDKFVKMCYIVNRPRESEGRLPRCLSFLKSREREEEKAVLRIKVVIITMAVALLSGCATLNFSAHYYTLPTNYQEDFKRCWIDLTSKLDLVDTYIIDITTDKGTKGTAGVPEIEGTTIRVPLNYIKYVYQNYYNDRCKIFKCILTHEICHTEYSMRMGTLQQHYEVDRKAISMLIFAGEATSEDYYKSLFVTSDYWFSRKGVLGHVGNFLWNALNIFSLAYTGVGEVGNLYATDLSWRMIFIAGDYEVESGSKFERSSSFSE